MTTSSEWRLWLNGLTFHLECVVEGLQKMKVEEEKIYKAIGENVSMAHEEVHQDHLLFRKDIRRVTTMLRKARAAMPTLPFHVVADEGETK